MICIPLPEMLTFLSLPTEALESSCQKFKDFFLVEATFPTHGLSPPLALCHFGKSLMILCCSFLGGF